MKETKTTCQAERAKVKADPNWDFLAVQWLKLCTSTAGAQVSSLVKELRYHMLRGTTKIKKKLNSTGFLYLKKKKRGPKLGSRMETKFKEIGASKGEGSVEGTAERFPFTFSREKSVLNHECWGAEAAAAAKSLQSCPTLCNPIDSSPPGSSVPGILQARILEWVAVSFSRGLRGCSQNNVDFISFHLIHVGANWGLLFRTFNCLLSRCF